MELEQEEYSIMLSVNMLFIKEFIESHITEMFSLDTCFII